jgi:Response regulators consisting of a CheY-like receiver domain and a winged-helix DNA-binding domain
VDGMKNVMIVEDEYRMRALLADYFKINDFGVVEAGDGETALQKFKEGGIDLIILDIMLPRTDGWTVCRTIRKTSDVPIIILTAKSEEDDKLLGYELGADDYVTKPFSLKILMAKVKALFKRVEGTPANQGDIIDIDGLRINETAHEVTVNGSEINLSPKEYELLLYLVKNMGVALTRDMILDNVWGFDYFGDVRTVDTHIKRLREKIGEKGDMINTIRGSGYRFGVKK